MTLANPSMLMKEATASQRVIAAFNIFNAESLNAVVRAAESLDVPVILSVNEPDMKHLGSEEVAALARARAGAAQVPVILHLDHGMSLATVIQCLRAGFTSIMIDASASPAEEGRAMVRSAVDICHCVGVPVESLVGRLRLALAVEGESGSVEELTDPEKAAAFVAATGIDSLAVSIGTEHGGYLLGKRPRLDLARLAEIEERVAVPLVVHGGSALGEEQLRELRRHRVGKLNIGSVIRTEYRNALLAAFQEGVTDIRDASARGEQIVYEVARRKMEILSREPA
ncbi:MAG: class II fructose-bisphosphate aldolase [Spirochaetia bacterium]